MFNFDLKGARYLGLCMCGRSLKELTFSEAFNPKGHDISSIMMFCGFELIIKSIIAEKIDKAFLFPNKNKKNKDYIIGCSDAYKIIQLNFGNLGLEKYVGLFKDMIDFRNGMIHKGKGDQKDSIGFWFYIVENIVNNVLDDSIINYFSDYDPDGVEYIFEMLERNNISLDVEKYNKLLDKSIFSSLIAQLNV